VGASSALCMRIGDAKALDTAIPAHYLSGAQIQGNSELLAMVNRLRPARLASRA